mmetsp:Transcript_589/g.984  ORF Transcript_589/g.984 Transcript_589/m.984 type:complete len:200 (+) Transcript_589:1314-1913(+)
MRTRLHTLHKFENTVSSPSEVIVINHHSLRETSSSGGVDKSAAVSRFLTSDSLSEKVSKRTLLVLSKVGEIIPGKDSEAINRVGERTAPHNQSRQMGKLVFGFDKFLSLVGILTKDNLSFTVRSNISSSLRSVCGVNTSGFSTTGNSSHVTQEPLWRVETNNTNRSKVLNTELQESTANLHGVFVIHVPRPDSVVVRRN